MRAASCAIKPALILQGDNRIDLLQRVPSDLRSYLEYNFKLKKEYGSVMAFVLRNRLGWEDGFTKTSMSFEDPSNSTFCITLFVRKKRLIAKDGYRIIYNDWPYGLDPKIVHLVIWTKFELEVDTVTDDLTPRARQILDEFVNATFAKSMPLDRVS